MTELGRQLKLQARWCLWPDCAPNSERPQFGMPLSFDRCMPLVQSVAERRAAAAVPLPESP